MSKKEAYPDKNRFWNWIMELGEITDADKPFTRRSFSPMFLKGREWISEKMESLGLRTHIDAAGNLIGRLEGTDPDKGTILIGSHSDSVPSGGRFDGMAGIITGLECIASWKDAGISLNHAIEVVDYLAEEPSEWGISCVGSRGITGFMTDELLKTKHPENCETLKDAIVRIGGNPDNLCKREDIRAAFELHIEQGRVLETEDISVGIVSSIVGILRLSIVFEGEAGHAGTTPMDDRRDASVAAFRTAWLANEIANKIWKESGHYLTATCGQSFIVPNASNVIPGKATLVFDIRSDDKETMEIFASELLAIAKKSAGLANVQLAEFERMTDTTPVNCDEKLMNLLSNAGSQLKVKSKIMASGAGHDAAFLAHIAPTAMLFTPSKNGVSHSPDEWTSAEQFEPCIAVLMKAIEEFDRNN